MKAKILREITQLAKTNEGKAPSMQQFRTATGIREHDWQGKIWARWSDAIAEAGLQPQEMQRAEFSDDELIGLYATVCRLHGRPPTQAELSIYASQSAASFPQPKTFRRRLGGKKVLLQQLKAWAEKAGDAEIVGMLPNDLLPEMPASEGEADTFAEGWVYLLQSGDHYKVGRSEDLEKRIKQISVAMPQKVELVHAIKTDDTSGIELYWHRRFAEKRRNGEWFELSNTEVQAFKKRKYQ